MKKQSLFSVFFATALACSTFVGANAQIISTIAGTGVAGYAGDGAASATEFNNPFALATDKKGNLYIADWSNNRVRKMNIETGMITTFAGNGIGGYCGDNIPATNSSLYAPSGVALDAIGNVYISDRANCRIRKVDTFGIITTIAGNGATTFAGDNGPATNASIFAPFGVCLDRYNNVYIADWNNFRVRKVDTNGIITTIAGRDSMGFSGDGGPATAAKMWAPSGVTVDSAGNVYIADFFNRRIRKVTTDGIINTFAGNGTYTVLGDGGPATAAALVGPYAVALDKQGNIYIPDGSGNRIRKVSASGDMANIITTYAGTGATGFLGDGGLATAAEFNLPMGIAFDTLGVMYVADQDNQRIRKISAPTLYNNIIVNAITGLKIAPNPASILFTVTITSPQTIAAKVNITNMLGEEVKTVSCSTNQPIDITLNVPTGIYTILAKTQNGSWSQKIVIEK